MIRPLLPAACALLVATAAAADWPQWRGPDRSGRSPDTGLLKQWPAGGPKRLWLFQDAGLGYAGYSVAGGRLFTMGLRGDQEFVIAVNVADGTEAWAAPVGPKYPNDWGDGPRMTPTVDGDRVYAIGGQGLLVCLGTADGKSVWEKSLTRDLGGRLQNWGYTESPLIAGDRLFCTPGGPRGTMAALNKLTGEVLWRSTDLTDDAQYASPILIEHAGRPQLVQLVMRRFFGLNPEDGKLLWQAEFDGRVAVIPTPIFHDGHVYVTAGYGIGSKLVKLGPDNAVSVVYDNKVMKNHHGGVVLVGRHLYGYSDGPGWICQDFFTGEEVWADKSLGKGATHFADGMLYCLDERSGEVALVEASPEGWKEKGRFQLAPLSEKRAPRGGIWPHPVVIGGRLFLRDQENLFCFDVKGS
ncbi:MAG TPA: PQQ-like beta-propeller repeat protein [Verrucomicrobiota bacterium]|nr:PQQ-like beta-propeller repeat protein [Verrucomicrobiota bacterium]